MNATIKEGKKITKEDFINSGYFLLPLIINLVISMIFFVIVEVSSSFFSSLDEPSLAFLIISLIVGIVVAVGRFLLNFFLPRKWRKIYQREMSFLHWGIASVIYIVLIVALIFTVQAIVPELKGLILWPVLSIIFVSSFDLLMVMFGTIFLIGEISGVTGEGVFILVLGIVYLFIIILIPMVILPNFLVILGYRLGNKKFKEGLEISQKDTFENKVESWDDQEKVDEKKEDLEF